MKLQDLIKNHHWLSIKEILIEITNGETNLHEYNRIFNELKYLDIQTSPIILMIERHWEDGEPTKYGHAFGFNPSIPKTEPTPYVALEWTTWNKWLGFEIHKDAIEEWTELEIICHCLLEMTLDGFTQNEIRSTSNQIIKSVDIISTKYFKNKLDNK